jgi:hypothetical protein
VKKWLVRIVLGLVGTYLVLTAALMIVMVQPPDRFGQIMNHVPMILAWGVLPGPSIWQWARKGTLVEGDMAPDFTLARHDTEGKVTLSAHRDQKPVVLVFGSYT